jgi:hypothetical protein
VFAFSFLPPCLVGPFEDGHWGGELFWPCCLCFKTLPLPSAPRPRQALSPPGPGCGNSCSDCWRTGLARHKVLLRNKAPKPGESSGRPRGRDLSISNEISVIFPGGATTHRPYPGGASGCTRVQEYCTRGHGGGSICFNLRGRCGVGVGVKQGPKTPHLGGQTRLAPRRAAGRCRGWGRAAPCFRCTPLYPGTVKWGP